MQTKDHNVMINGQNNFDKQVNYDLRTYDNIQKLATDQIDNYTLDCPLDYFYLKNYDKMIAVDLSKQQALDVDPKVKQQINFIGNIDRDGSWQQCFSLLEKHKKLFWVFHKEL